MHDRELMEDAISEASDQAARAYYEYKTTPGDSGALRALHAATQLGELTGHSSTSVLSQLDRAYRKAL